MIGKKTHNPETFYLSVSPHQKPNEVVVFSAFCRFFHKFTVITTTIYFSYKISYNKKSRSILWK